MDRDRDRDRGDLGIIIVDRDLLRRCWAEVARDGGDLLSVFGW